MNGDSVRRPGVQWIRTEGLRAATPAPLDGDRFAARLVLLLVVACVVLSLYDMYLLLVGLH